MQTWELCQICTHTHTHTPYLFSVCGVFDLHFMGPVQNKIRQPEDLQELAGGISFSPDPLFTFPLSWKHPLSSPLFLLPLLIPPWKEPCPSPSASNTVVVARNCHQVICFLKLRALILSCGEVNLSQSILFLAFRFFWIPGALLRPQKSSVWGPNLWI